MTNDHTVIKLRETFGENLLSAEEGDRLRESIHLDLKQGRNVVLDFDGVRIIASAFLNTGIGQLYADVDERALREHLSVRNLSDVGKFALRRVVENSKRYYADDSFRAAADSLQTGLLEA